MRNAPLRITLAAAVAFGTALAVATPASAHAGVTASDARGLAKNVTLTFTSEAESKSAGLAMLQVVLPEGISPGTVSLKKGPEGWRLAQAQGGFTISGKPLPTGEKAVYSIVVKQLPDAESLVFKTVETYSDGKLARWVEEPKDGKKPENPAPVLKLKSASKEAKWEGTPVAPSKPPIPVSDKKSDGSQAESGTGDQTQAAEESKDSGGMGVAIGVLALVVVAAGGVIMWVFKRRSSATS
ncbi:DUF1775 domain-containing protein [Streptomyces albipurpureus]|uniref:YcnI family protein n=1 Tax=Streptomyces albipurpureus TaxID=2897419 RepID=A0ABT0UEM2_9ACTN|nr:DUF1775 domain-containing protein [Streptomyces sp. CWNU-1]MCM2387004.1 YcnI family protein [Streptomyces sp. CWNU-1]